MRDSDACWHSCILHLASLAQLQYNVTSPVLLSKNLNCKKKKISRNASSRTDLGNLTQTDIQVACICMLPHSNAAIKTVLQQVTVSSCWISCLQVALLLWLITVVHQLLKLCQQVTWVLWLITIAHQLLCLQVAWVLWLITIAHQLLNELLCLQV